MSEEESIDHQESLLPPLSGQAFHNAYAEKLAAGESVLIIDDGNLVEVFPNGTRTFLKSIGSARHIAPGTKIQLR